MKLKTINKMKMLKRLLIKLPLLIIWLVLTVTIIVPLIHWVITGDFDGWMEIAEWIDEL